jgi:hypothetical protein
MVRGKETGLARPHSGCENQGCEPSRTTDGIERAEREGIHQLPLTLWRTYRFLFSTRGAIDAEFPRGKTWVRAGRQPNFPGLLEEGDVPRAPPRRRIAGDERRGNVVALPYKTVLD